MQLVIREEFQDLIPPLSLAEYSQLERNIVADGCRDPIVVWNNTILDGHNRYNICGNNNLEFSTAPIYFNGELDAKEWMINNQFGRRNLPNFVRAELALKLKPVIAERAKAKQGERTDISQNSVESKPIDTQKELAKKAGVSHDTIARTEKILEKASEETIQKLRSGEISINQAHKDLKNDGQSNHSETNSDDEYHTPKCYIESVKAVMGVIDLDPASNADAQKVVNAKQYYTIDDSALTKKRWVGRVWMNPPYSRIISEFCEKLANEFEKGNVDEAITLTNNGTDTSWFHRLSGVASAICHHKGRIGFIKNGKPTENNNKGQVVFYIGHNTKKFVAEFSQYGSVYVKP